jgi:hypothetical protein
MLADLKKGHKKSDAEQTTKKGKKDSRKGKKHSDQSKKSLPPFAKSDGKEGDTKEWNGKTYHYCSGKHADGVHWVIHKPADCLRKRKNPSNQGDKSKKNSEKNISVNKQKLKAAASLLADKAGIDPETTEKSFFALVGDSDSEADDSVSNY